MNRVNFLFVLFFLLQFIAELKAQKIQIPSDDLFLNQGKTLQHSSEIPETENLFYLDDKLDKYFSQAYGNYLLETLKREIWNESSSGWVNDSLYDYSYNEMDLVDTIIAHKWRNGNVWGNDGRWRYLYNSNSKLIQRYNGEWATTYWSEFSRNDYSYSGPNQNLAKISFYWYSSNTWVLEAYDVYSWNTNNHLTNVTSYTLHNLSLDLLCILER
ncbi:MAG: hypothetical protein P8X47_07720 [Ignavibacteriaceae bacterium]